MGVGRFLLDDHAIRRRGTRRAARARLRANARFGVEERRRRVPGALSFSRARVEPAMRSPYYSLHLSSKFSSESVPPTRSSEVIDSRSDRLYC